LYLPQLAALNDLYGPVMHHRIRAQGGGRSGAFGRYFIPRRNVAASPHE
jgi:hypothetical protein